MDHWTLLKAIVICCILNVPESFQLHLNSTNADHKETHQNCIECERVTRITLMPSSSIYFHEIRKNLFLPRVLSDHSKLELIDLKETCLKPVLTMNIKTHSNKIKQKPAKRKSIFYVRGNQFRRWFSYLSDLVGEYLPSRNGICVECVRRRKIIPVSKLKRTKYEEFKLVLYGPFVRRNTHSLTCQLPQNCKMSSKFVQQNYSNVNENSSFRREENKRNSNYTGWFTYINKYFQSHLSSRKDSQEIIIETQEKITSQSRFSLLQHEEWYYWFGRVFRLTCISKIDYHPHLKKEKKSLYQNESSKPDASRNDSLTLSPIESANDTLETAQTNEDGESRDVWYEHWFYHFKSYFKSEPSRTGVNTSNETVEDERRTETHIHPDDLASNWWRRFILSLKLVTKNKLFTQHKTHECKIPIKKTVTQNWYEQFLSYFRLSCTRLVKTTSVDMTNVEKETISSTNIDQVIDAKTKSGENVTSPVPVSSNDLTTAQKRPTPWPIVMVTKPYDKNITESVTPAKKEVDISQYAKRKIFLHTSRQIRGEVDDASLFFLLVACFTCWFLHKAITSIFRRSTLPHSVAVPDVLPPEKSDPTTITKPVGVTTSVTKKKCRKMLCPPAVVIAVRRTLELELVVATVEVSPYPNYRTKTCGVMC